MPKLKDVTSKNVLKNMMDHLDELADKYRTEKTTDALITYIQYRDDYIHLEPKLAFLKLYPDGVHTFWNLMVYESLVTDELEIFHNGKTVPDNKLVQEVKEWRRSFDAE